MTLNYFIGRPFVKRFALCYRTVVCPVCDVGVLWPNGLMDQDETWHCVDVVLLLYVEDDIGTLSCSEWPSDYRPRL